MNRETQTSKETDYDRTTAHPENLDLTRPAKTDLEIEDDNQSLIEALNATAQHIPSTKVLDSNDDRFEEMPEPNPALKVVDHLLSGTETKGYVLLDLPVSGGMGSVYKAWNIKLERIVALKLSKQPDDIGSTRLKEEDHQLRTEAAMLARLEHPSIATCFGYGRFEEYSFLEMQWVEGISLASFMKEVKSQDRVDELSDNILLPWMLAMVEALLFCKLRGVHHLDLKPQNIMLTPNASAKASVDLGEIEPADADSFRSWCQSQQVIILDFGLAQKTATPSKSIPVAGTPSYMAPEQFEQSVSDPTLVDIYCLGGILYHLLTGLSPNTDKKVGYKTAYRTKDASAVCVRDAPIAIRSTISPDLNAIALKCLHFAPGGRYHRFDELYNDLKASQNHRPISARELGPIERVARYTKRHPYSVAIISMLVVGLSVTAFLLLSLSSAIAQVRSARESDRKTFKVALDSIATIDKEFLTDQQLNQPENRDLAIRFKSTLFELYQILASREAIEILDRRRLAEVSARLATDQKERGDYELAAKFFNSAVSQYSALTSLDEATNLDEKAAMQAEIESIQVKARLSRTIYPEHELLSDSSRIIQTASQRFGDEMQLAALASHCGLKFSLEGRGGAAASGELLKQASEISTRFQSRTVSEKITKARALYRIGLVGYKGGAGEFERPLAESISLYQQLVPDPENDKLGVAREFASAINLNAMTLVGKLRRMKVMIREYNDVDQLDDYQALKLRIERDYFQSAKLIDSAFQKDPLNNLTLRSKIMSHWNLADFYYSCELEDSDWQSSLEIEHHERCIELISELLRRQPQSALAGQSLGLQWFRLSRCYRRLSNPRKESECLNELVSISNWQELTQFETSDKFQLIPALLDNIRREQSSVELTMFELGEVVKSVTETYQEAFVKYGPLKIDASLYEEMSPESVDQLGPEFNDLKSELRRFFEMARFE